MANGDTATEERPAESKSDSVFLTADDSVAVPRSSDSVFQTATGTRGGQWPATPPSESTGPWGGGVVVRESESEWGRPKPPAAQPQQEDDPGGYQALGKLKAELLENERKQAALSGAHSKQELEQLDARRGELNRQNAAVAHSIDAMPKPWNADQEAQNRIRGPFENFGSLATIFALTASAFTKQPMVNAMNATAAAMTAMRNSDEEGYERAYKAWKDNTELAHKRFEMEQQVFQNTDKLFTTDINRWKVQKEADLAKFGHDTALAAMRGGFYPQVFEWQSAQADANSKSVKAAEDIDRLKSSQDFIKSGMEEAAEQHPKWTKRQQNEYQLLLGAKARAAYEKNPTTENIYSALIDYFNTHDGQRMPASEVQDLVARAHSYGRSTPAQQVATLAAELHKPVEEGGENLPWTEAIPKAERLIAQGRESGKVEARRPELEYKAETRKELFNLKSNLQQELAKLHEAGKDYRAEGSADLKREMAKLSIDARKDIIDTLERGRRERQLEAEQAKTDRAAKHEAAVTERAKAALEGKQQAEASMSDEAINSLVERTIAGEPTASILRTIGYGRQPSSNRARYNDALAATMKERGITPDDLVKKQAEWQGKLAAGRTAGGAETRALSSALTKTTENSSALEQYERSMLRQLDILVNLGRKVDRSGVPAIERWSRPGRKALGDPDVAEFDTQWTLVSTEAARVINSPRLVGVLTDTARKEMQEALPKSSNIKQLERVAARLHSDADIRREEIGRQIDTLVEQIKTGHIKPYEKPKQDDFKGWH